MAIFRLEPTITKEYLLSKYSQETYLNYYLGVPVRKGLFVSPLRDDKNPTCSFYRNKKGDIIFKDFGSDMRGNFINVVMFKYNCSYYEALKIIGNDFGFIHTDRPKTRKVVKVSEDKFEETQEAVIQVEIKDFSTEELKWWNQFGVTEDILKKFRIFSCNTVFLNGNIFTTSSKSHPVYGYYRGKNSKGMELWRIYLPKHRKREPKFLSNWRATMLQGAKQLPTSGDVLVVTKALKDVACLYSLGITAVAPNSENLFLTEKQFEALHKRFKNIVIFYDNDLAGIQNMNKFRKKFGVKCFWIPRKYGAKDISDYYNKFGREKTLELIEYAKEKL